MIRYYGVTHSECNGKILFVLKLDECQVGKGQRLERVSITMMSMAKSLRKKIHLVTAGAN